MQHSSPALALVLFAGILQAQPKPAEEVFKNIQALKGTPSDQLFPAMQFISASLGVDCEFCHLQGKFELDDNQHKLTARKMIAMTLSINKDSFDGHTEVTCNSCHRGKTDPVATPPLDNGEVKPPAPVAQASPAGATAAQILEK